MTIRSDSWALFVCIQALFMFGHAAFAPAQQADGSAQAREMTQATGRAVVAHVETQLVDLMSDDSKIASLKIKRLLEQLPEDYDYSSTSDLLRQARMRVLAYELERTVGQIPSAPERPERWYEDEQYAQQWDAYETSVKKFVPAFEKNYVALRSLVGAGEQALYAGILNRARVVLSSVKPSDEEFKERDKIRKQVEKQERTARERQVMADKPLAKFPTGMTVHRDSWNWPITLGAQNTWEHRFKDNQGKEHNVVISAALTRRSLLGYHDIAWTMTVDGESQSQNRWNFKIRIDPVLCQVTENEIVLYRTDYGEPSVLREQ